MFKADSEQKNDLCYRKILNNTKWILRKNCLNGRLSLKSINMNNELNRIIRTDFDQQERYTQELKIEKDISILRIQDLVYILWFKNEYSIPKFVKKANLKIFNNVGNNEIIDVTDDLYEIIEELRVERNKEI